MVGRKISHYKITEKLGEGGMGVVYKAEDTQLRRIVALKFLSSETVGNEEVKARLIREAQASASLDHPNICAVHGIHEEQGQTFIAMAYIDGPALADKIRERPLPLDEALSIATQIAEGLQEAHEKGIVHRDIKPHNVMLTAKGQIKIMDFGLAAIAGRSKLTKSGTTLGTPAYMAPEQLEGRDVDRRADIWALGCVLYEMLTQRTPFDAEYEQAIAYGILNEEPEPVTALRSGLPTEIDRVVSKALARAAGQRYQHADDLLVDLRRLAAEPVKPVAASVSDPSPAEPGGIPDPGPTDTLTLSKRRLRIERMLLGILVLGFIGLSFAYFSRSLTETPAAGPIRRFSFPVKGMGQGTAKISPDGRNIVYEADSGLLAVWSLETDSTRELPGTEGARGAFWSPNGLHIGFEDPGSVKRVPLDGGEPLTLCETPGRIYRGGAWSPDGKVIVFSANTRLYEVAAVGGPPKLVFEPGDQPRPIPLTPHFLPTDSRRRALVYTAATSATLGQLTDTRVAFLDLDSGETRELAAGSFPVYSSGGYLVFGPESSDERGLRALAFSLETLEAAGEAFPIVAGGHRPSVAADGTLVYTDVADPPKLGLVWRNRQGDVTSTISEPQPLMSEPALSPDGDRIAVRTVEGGNHNVWIYNLAESTRTQVTFDEAIEGRPVWSPLGDELAYVRQSGDGTDSIMGRAADGSGSASLLVEQFGAYYPNWSGDGRHLLYSGFGSAESRLDIFLLRRSPDGLGFELDTFRNTLALEAVPEFSPNGRFVAYTSSEAPPGSNVFVRPFPDSDSGFWRVSPDGGTQPRWRRDSKELYYLQDNKTLMAVPVSIGDTFRSAKPTRLFESEDFGSLIGAGGGANYDVSADGQRFVTIKRMDDPAPPTLRIVQNWHQEFRNRE